MIDSDHPKEECGVVGVWAETEDAAKLSFFSVFALQHRGQESAGIAVADGSRVRMHKDMGLVSQVFNEEILQSMPGSLGLAHVRYSTTGASVLRNAQPVYCTSSIGEIAIAHNGNLLNAVELREEMEAEGHQFDSTADSEVIARLVAERLDYGLEDAVAYAMSRIKGAYSAIALSRDSVVGFRDPNGLRPLSVGRFPDGVLMASESCAFSPLGGEVEREVGPGEMAIVQEGELRYAQGVPPSPETLCLFEFIYFARPDSEMYGTTLYSARERMGAELAREHPVEADIVVPVPDSGIPAALGYSRDSGIDFCEAMTKSRYIHRTFIQPDQRMREMGVRMKLSPIEPHIRGQRVILVDDSIVRATTTKQIVRMMFECGAKEVHVRITAPPITNPCFYGIDMATPRELAAASMSVDEIRDHVGATSLGYLSIDGAVKAVGRPRSSFCLACFSGQYPLDVPAGLTKEAFERPKVGQIASVNTSQPGLFES